MDSQKDTDWLHSDPWRVLRIQSEFVNGFGALAEMPPAVTVFGSARIGEGKFYDLGRELGQKLVRANYAVITGGGPGLMESSNRGALEEGGLSVGLGIELPHEQHLNDFVDLCMVQTGKITHYPIALIGTEFWGGLVDWIKDRLVAEGMISPDDTDLFIVTDSVDEVVDHITQAHADLDR